MADGTKIEWADATVNAINGCSVVSPGCTNCYAMRLAGTRLRHHPSRAGLTIDSKAGPVWNGKVRLNEEQLMQPLRWKRPRRIFWNAHGDTFHDAVPDEWIDLIFAICALTPQHTHMILTKRSARMREYLSTTGREGAANRVNYTAEILGAGRLPVDRWPRSWPYSNVWLGVSAEDQARADERIPDLLATPAAVRFISAEPLLGPLDLSHIELRPHGALPTELSRLLGDYVNPLRGTMKGVPTIHWVIAGGESGPGARPMHPDWARSLRDQCAAAGVAFHFKQWGEFAPGEIAGDFLDPEKPAKGLSLFDGRWDKCWSEVEGRYDDEPDVYRIGKARAGRTLDGRTHDEWPA